MILAISQECNGSKAPRRDSDRACKRVLLHGSAPKPSRKNIIMYALHTPALMICIDRQSIISHEVHALCLRKRRALPGKVHVAIRSLTGEDPIAKPITASVHGSLVRFW